MPTKNKKISKIVKIFDPRMWFYDFAKWTGGLTAVLFFRQKRTFINGKKPRHFYKDSSIIISNHISYLDPIIISNAYWPRRCAFVATSDLFRGKFAKNLFKLFGCIEVDKKNVSVKTFKQTTKMLNRGHCVIVFPDGGIIRDESHPGFKSGAVMMALMAKVSIIPMCIVKRKHWWQRQHVFVGEKFNVFDYIKNPFPSVEDINYVTKKLEEKEKELKELAKEKIK